MRFMVIVPANAESESGKLPDEKILTAMGKFNEEMVKAGVMLAGEGLHPSSKGARLRFAGGQSQRHRRTLHRVQGADCRVLADPGQVQAGGDRMDEARPVR